MYFLMQAKNNVAALELMRLLGVCYRTAGRLKHTILEVMAERESERQLVGHVEADDAYFGGAHPGGKRGRGSDNKVPFIAAVQISPERPSGIYHILQGENVRKSRCGAMGIATSGSSEYRRLRWFELLHRSAGGRCKA